MGDAMKEKWPILYSQRRELARVIHWLRSERFKCDLESRGVANDIARLIEDGTYEKETSWSRGPDAPDVPEVPGLTSTRERGGA